jgi:hypothetical protein
MDGQTRTKSYPGLFRSQAEEAFRRDAAEAVAHGWQPTAQQWNGLDLVVTYTYGPPAPIAQPTAPMVPPLPPPARRDSPWPMIGAITALVALGAITGLAVSGQSPFGSESKGAPSATARPYVPPANGGAAGQAGAVSGGTCHDWDARLDEHQRHTMSVELLSGFRRDDGMEPATPPDDDVFLMSGILDAMCAEPGNAGQSVEAMASLIWMSEALQD